MEKIKERALERRQELFHSNSILVGFRGSVAHNTYLPNTDPMGEKRKSLVEKFGFDCANASHAIRLLRQGITFLREGKIEVHRRRDAEELLLIKTGAWSLEKVKMEAEMLFTIAKVAYEESELPDKPNYEAVDELVYKIMYDYLYNG
jgi:hypothetical protein